MVNCEHWQNPVFRSINNFKKVTQNGNSHNILLLLLVAGELVLLWFFRRREFEADELAAGLVSPEAMNKALQRLKADEAMGVATEAGTPAAVMLIIAPPAWMDIFSTHPATARRINHFERVFSSDTQ